MSFINEHLLTKTLYIRTDIINKDIDNIIRNELNQKMGNICNDEGFVIAGSISLIKRSIGEIITNNNKSMVKYITTFKCKVISPCEGDELECYVHNINKLGVISYIRLGLKDIEKFEDSPIISITPNEYFEDSSLNINDIHIGQVIKIKVIGVRSKYNSDKIQIVSKPLS
jgi:hypothetical protein